MATNQGWETLCQIETQDHFTRRRRPVWFFGPRGVLPRVRRYGMRLNNAWRTTRRKGLAPAARLAADTLFNRQPKAAWKTPQCEGENLNLQPGEAVWVKSVEEICQTLDSQGRNYGLYFTVEMKEFCGTPQRVFKRVESMFNEFSGEQRSVRHGTVILQNVYCQGKGLGCDRSCFHLWREAWLSRRPPQ